MGRRIASLRITCNVTQEALAEGSGVDARYLQRIEAGEKNTTVDTLVKIANVLRVGVATLFAEEPPPARLARGSAGKAQPRKSPLRSRRGRTAP